MARIYGFLETKLYFEKVCLKAGINEVMTKLIKNIIQGGFRHTHLKGVFEMKRYLILFAILVLVVSSGIGAFAATAPTLSLDVMVLATATSGTTNVVYFTAKLSPLPVVSTEPIVIDFYNGSSMLAVYPYNYLGSAKMDNTGKAQLRIANHKSGTFAGGAIWANSPWGKIFAPVKIYKVP
jgi:hypothetical protein